MKLWLDDVRLPPDESWTWVKTYTDAVNHLWTGDVKEISLDHDLGMIPGTATKSGIIPATMKPGKTGYDVACFIEEYVRKGRIPKPMMYCHSANPVGRQRIYAVIDSLNRHV